MEHIPLGAWAAFGGLIFTILSATGGIIWTLVWKLSDIREATDAKLIGAVTERDKLLQALRAELIAGTDTVRQQAGEIGHSVTSKIQQMELYIRDKYVLKEDFHQDLKTITSIIDTLGVRIEKRLDSFEEKLDTLQQFNMRHRENA